MLSVDMTGDRLADQTKTTIVSSLNTFGTNPGLSLGLVYTDVSIVSPLTPTTLSLTDIESGAAVAASYLVGPDGTTSNPNEPTLPLDIQNVNPSNSPGLVLRGLGFRGGAYRDESGIIPLTGAPTTEIRGVHGRFPSEVFYPIRPWRINLFRSAD